MKKDERFVIFGGGGIRGLAYCGAYKALIDNNITLTGCAGSSIGAVFAALLALDYKYDEIYEILSNTGFEMFIDINMDLKKEIAFSKGKIFYEWMKEQIEKKFYKVDYEKGKMPPVKFSDVKSKLIIYSVDLTNLKFREFSMEKSPDFEIAQAVRASVSMPGLFTPQEIDGNLIVDGDLLKSTPLWRVTNSIKDLNERIIEFRLEDNETPKKIINSLDYLNRVYNGICGFATDYIIDLYNEKDKFDYIKINTEGISVVDFLIPKEKKKELFEIGNSTTNAYLKGFLKEKKKKNSEKYSKLLSYVMKLQKEFNKAAAINLYLYLCEIFMFLCEEKKYLDTEIYNLIVKFRNEFIKNYKKTVFFGFKRTDLFNKTKLYDLLLEIVRKIGLKIEELKD